MTATYTLTQSADLILRNADQAFIPRDLRNADWRAYQVWLAAGNLPDPYIQPAPTAAEILDTAFVSDPDRQALVAQVAGATPAQIRTYIMNNVVDLASARLMLIRLALLVARLTKS